MRKAETPNRKVSRRLFLKSAAAVAGIAGLEPLLAACATPSQTSPAPTGPTAAPVAPAAKAAPTAAPAAAPTSAAAQAKRGGTLAVAVSDFSAENWHLWNNISLVNSALSVPFEYLIYRDPNDVYKLAPGLAESWTNKDMKEWTIKIRKGVQWDKGYGEFTAEDVAFTLKRDTQPDGKGTDVPYFRSVVPKMQVVDPYTITFKFDTVQPDLAYMLSPWSGMVMVCKKYVEAVGEDKASQEPIGTSAYRLANHVSGSLVEYDAIGNTHYRLPAKWEKMRFQKIPELATRYAMLQSGQADLVLVDPTYAQRAKDDGFLVITSLFQAPVGMFFGGLFPPTHPEYQGKDPWQDVRVRQAMALAIDSQAINKAFFNSIGTFEPNLSQALAPDSAAASFGQKPYDPDKARQLLKEAGKEGFEFKLISMADPRAPRTVEVIQAVASYWEAIGLKPKITPSDRVTYTTVWRGDKTNGQVFLWSGKLWPTYQQTLQKFFYSKAVGFKIYADEHTDSVYEELTKTGDQATRDKMLADMTLYLLNKWSWVQLANIPDLLWAANPKKVASWRYDNGGIALAWTYIEPKL